MHIVSVLFALFTMLFRAEPWTAEFERGFEPCADINLVVYTLHEDVLVEVELTFRGEPAGFVQGATDDQTRLYVVLRDGVVRDAVRITTDDTVIFVEAHCWAEATPSYTVFIPFVSRGGD